MKIYEPICGQHLHVVASKMAALAVQSGETVVAEFHSESGLVLVARPGTTAPEIEAQFDRLMSKGNSDD